MVAPVAQRMIGELEPQILIWAMVIAVMIVAEEEHMWMRVQVHVLKIKHWF